MSSELLYSLGQFMAAYALVLVVPGSIMITTGSIAALDGLGRATNFVFGVAAGAGLMTACAGLATGTLLARVPLSVGQAGSAAILLFMSVMLLAAPHVSSGARKPISTATIVTLGSAGLVTALTSPLTAIFTTAMFSGPMAGARAPLSVLLTAVLVTLANLIWYLGLATFLSRPAIRLVLLKNQGAARAGSAAMLLALAVLAIAGALTPPAPLV